MAAKKKKTTTTTTTVVTEEEIVAAPSVTRVVLVIDRSGSMDSIEKETFNNINEQLATLKRDAAKGGKMFVSYIQFDDVIETVFDNVPAEDLKLITKAQYKPRGGTALYDAQLRAMLALQKADDPADAAYLVITITDGMNNASKEINQWELAKKIKEYEAKGNWTFTYMMANIDIKQFAYNMNVPLGNVAAFAATPTGAVAAAGIMVNSTSDYLKSRSRGLTSVKTFYSSPDEVIGNATVAAPDVDAASVLSPTLDQTKPTTTTTK
jgi:uncharacterized protein YegL